MRAKPIGIHGVTKSPYLLLLESPGAEPSWVIVHGSKRNALAIPRERLADAVAEIEDYVAHLRRPPPKGWEPRYRIPHILRGATIYFISTDDVPRYPIKIGVTSDSDVQKRLATIQISCPYKLKVIATMDAPAETERFLHREFARERMQGEWFTRSRRLAAYLRKIGEARGDHPGTRMTRTEIEQNAPKSSGCEEKVLDLR